jgi:hypothetical protein
VFPVRTCEEVLRLYQERYFDLSVRHFHEKLKEEQSTELTYTWVTQARKESGSSRGNGAGRIGGGENGNR